MSVRRRSDGRVLVELYDPVAKRKRTLSHAEIRDLGFDPPINERQARRIERAALAARDRRRGADEPCDAFAERWPDDYRRGKGGRERSASTVEHNRERVTTWGRANAGRPLRSYSRAEARVHANQHPGSVPSLRAMFNDALEDRLVDENPFARLGIAPGRGRADLIVLTAAEIDELAVIARRHHGEVFGPEVSAMIIWGAYTCCRPGETFAARYSRLDGDLYDLGTQFNSRLRRETAPKHNSSGLIYVPEQAQDAVMEKPRRLGDELMFRTKRGRQFRQGSWHGAWDPVRRVFAAGLPADHHLARRLAEDDEDHLDFHELRHFGASYMLNELELEPWVIAEQLRHSDGGALVVRLYGHPDRRKALERIRRAYGSNLSQLPERATPEARHA